MQAVITQVKAAKREAKAAASLILQQELKARRRVLRRLGCVILSSLLILRSSVYASTPSARLPLQLAKACHSEDALLMRPFLVHLLLSGLHWQSSATV